MAPPISWIGIPIIVALIDCTHKLCSLIIYFMGFFANNDSREMKNQQCI